MKFLWILVFSTVITANVCAVNVKDLFNMLPNSAFGYYRLNGSLGSEYDLTTLLDPETTMIQNVKILKTVDVTNGYISLDFREIGMDYEVKTYYVEVAQFIGGSGKSYLAFKENTGIYNNFRVYRETNGALADVTDQVLNPGYRLAMTAMLTNFGSSDKIKAFADAKRKDNGIVLDFQIPRYGTTIAVHIAGLTFAGTDPDVEEFTDSFVDLKWDRAKEHFVLGNLHGN